MDVLTIGLLTTIIGMGTVFVVLIFLAVLISGLKIFAPKEKKADNQPEKLPVLPEAKAEIVSPVSPQPDDLELIAVITAAIAAQLNTTADKLVVRSFRRVTTWNDMAKQNKICR